MLKPIAITKKAAIKLLLNGGGGRFELPTFGYELKCIWLKPTGSNEIVNLVKIRVDID